MSPVLNILNDLCYVFESVSCDFTGEAKSELGLLCDRLENNPDYRVDGREEILSTCQKALELYYGMHYHEGSGILSGLCRELWQKV